MNTATTPRNKMTGFAARGGIDTSDLVNYPDARYWRNSAEATKAEIYFLCPESYEKHIEQVLAAVWNDRFSWLDIYRQSLIVLDFLQSHKEVLIERKS